jgi:transposase-like protein
MAMPLAKQTEVAERRARAVSMKARGARYADIARELGVTEATAAKDVSLAYKQRVAELRAEVDVVIAEQVEELDALRALAWREAITKHPHVTQSGRLAVHPDGSPVYDTAPNSRARRDLLAIQERKAKLLGLDAALKINVKAEIISLDAFDAAIAELTQQIAVEEQGGLPGTEETP